MKDKIELLYETEMPSKELPDWEYTIYYRTSSKEIEVQQDGYNETEEEFLEDIDEEYIQGYKDFFDKFRKACEDLEEERCR